MIADIFLWSTLMSMANRKSSPSVRTKKEQLVELLRDAILSGELQPGNRLLQEEIAERYNVSPTPVREAIQQLVAEGVLQHSPYRGVQVAEANRDDVHEVYRIRSVVERLATEMAVPNLKISDVQRLRAVQEALEDALGKAEQQTPVKLNNEFHMRIYEAAAMPQLLQIIKMLWIKTPWDTLFVVPNRSRMVIEEHRRVMDAIVAGDAVLAGQRMQEHLVNGGEALRHFLEKD
jgi:DNA-binding GntR family transcriptional regulator